METNSLLTAITNNIKLDLIIRRVTFNLRKIFMKRWKQMTGKEWVNNEKMGNEFIESIGSEVYSSAKKYQKLCLESGSIIKWDLKLLSKVLIDIKFTVSENTNKEFEKEIETQNESINKLIAIRNKFADNHNKYLTDPEFDELSDKLSDILESFGESKEDLKAINKMSFQDIVLKIDANKITSFSRPLICQKGYINYEVKDYIQLISNLSEQINTKSLTIEEKSILYLNRSLAHMFLYNSQIITKALSVDINCSKCITRDDNNSRYKSLMDAKYALELSPFWWRAYFRIGCAYDSLGKYSKSIKYFNKTIAMNPSAEYLTTARDLSLLKLGKLALFSHFDNSIPQTIIDVIFLKYKQSFCVNEETIKQMNDGLTQMNEPMADVIEGLKCMYGLECVQQDYEMAVKCFRKAANKKNVFAFFYLSQLAFEGNGVEKDVRKSFEQIAIAANYSLLNKSSLEINCIANAQYLMGFYFYEGISVKKDVSVAINWFTKSSENGSASAANSIGLLYMNGDGLDVSYDKAMDFLTLSQSRNGIKALYSIALCHLKFGNLVKALDFNQQAIDSGDNLPEITRKNFELIVSKMEKSKDYIKITKWEANSGLRSDIRLRSLKERKERMLTYQMIETHFQKRFPSSNSSSASSMVRNDEIIDNENRVNVIIGHRIHGLNMSDITIDDTFLFHLEHKPNKLKSVKSISECKPITFNEMDTTREHTYEGRFIEITFIEDYINGLSLIATLIQDNNFDVQKCVINNFKDFRNEDLVQKSFGFGTKGILIDPKMLTSMKGKPLICVDDCRLFIKSNQNSRTENTCRYCYAIEAKHACIKCKSVYYCNKKCQSKDWNKFRHKLVCDKFISLSEKMKLSK